MSQNISHRRTEEASATSYGHCGNDANIHVFGHAVGPSRTLLALFLLRLVGEEARPANREPPHSSRTGSSNRTWLLHTASRTVKAIGTWILGKRLATMRI